MAEIKDTDEYEFSELDAIDTGDTGLETTEEAAAKRPVQQTNVRRNALIVIGSIILIMLIYKFVSSYFQTTDNIEQQKVVVKPPEPAPQVQEVKVEAPPAETPPPAPSVDSSEIDQKLSSLDMSQQTMRSDLTNMNTQIDAINSNINALNSKFSILNQNITQLVTRLEQQSAQLSSLLVRKVRPHKPVMRRAYAPSLIYFIQAVIPGRAWLIASNGYTLTVREGSNISGYGVVKLIDPNQGRVLTSSGKIIRFNQQDS